MTPPVSQGGPTPTCNDDLSPIDLAPFQNLPSVSSLHQSQQKALPIKTLYGMVETARQMDATLGNHNGKLDKAEVDAFLKAQPESAEIFGTCEFMAQFRNFAARVPELKAELAKGPDLSPVDLNLFRGLPSLDQFPVIDTAENALPEAKEIEAKIRASALPAKLQDLLLSNEQLFFQYYVAQAYLKQDMDHDGKFSLDDASKSLARMNNTQTDPSEFLLEVKASALSSAFTGFDLREEFGFEAAPGLLDLRVILVISQMVPQLVQANPALSALISSVFPLDASGQPHPTPEVEDRIITLEEFKKFPGIQTYLQTSGKSAEEAFQSLQAIAPSLNLPVSLWPEDLQAVYEKMDKEPRDKLDLLMQLPVELQQMDWAIRMMEAESVSKYQQEKMDHAGGGRLFVSAVSYLASLGNWSWGNYFRNERPQAHKDTRDQAINELKKAIRENKFANLEEAVAWLAGNKTAEFQVLSDECNLASWVRLAKMTNNVDRNRELLKLAEEFREGDYKFWEFQLFPSPRLGKGGWWNRAFHADSWAWGKSPEIVMALGLNNYVGNDTPNNANAVIKNKPDFNFLAAQLPEEKRKAFVAVLERMAKGENVPPAEIQTVVATPTLSPEGQAELLTQVRIEMVKMQNQQAVQDPGFQAEYQKLTPEQQQKAAQLVGTVMELFVDPNNPMDPAKVKMAVESLDSTLAKVANVDISKEKQLVEGIHARELPESFKKALMKLLGNMKRVEGSQKPASALAALFREAKFPDVNRAWELFNLAQPTELQQAEFIGMIKASSLSLDNQKALLAILLTQPSSAVAKQAEENFYAILGYPMRDPSTGEFSLAYTGNLHSATRTTLNKTLFGVGGYTAPTLVGGSFGHALFKSFRNYAATPLEEITGFRRWLIPGRTFHRIGNIGGGKFFGNPIAGMLIFGAAGTAFTVSPYGEDLRHFAYEGITYPYLPWSDMATMNMPREGVQLYLSAAASMQGMDAILGTAKTIGTLELGTRTANGLRALQLGNRLAKRLEPVFPRAAEWLRARSSLNTAGLNAMGSAWRSAGNAFLGKTEAQIAEDLLKNAKLGEAKWAADVPELATAERVWAKSAYEQAQKELITARAWFTQTPQGARFAEIQDALARSGITPAEKVALEAEMKALSSQIPAQALNRLRMTHIKVRSLEVLGKVGPNPQFSKSILKRAKEWIEEGSRTGNTELIERGNTLLQKGAVQYMQLSMMGMHNQGMAKFILWMLFHEKIDESTRASVPVIPPFPSSIAAGAIVPPLPVPGKPGAKKAPAKAAPKAP